MNYINVRKSCYIYIYRLLGVRLHYLPCASLHDMWKNIAWLLDIGECCFAYPTPTFLNTLLIFVKWTQSIDILGAGWRCFYSMFILIFYHIFGAIFFNSKLVSGVYVISEALLRVIIVAIVIVYYNPKIILLTFMILHRIKWYRVVSIPHATGHNDTSAKLFGMTYAALNVNVGSWNWYVSGACVNVGCHIDGILIAICPWYLWWLDALKLMQVLLDIVYISIYIY